MFWRAVGSGLSVLGHYQVWIGAALVVAASIGSTLLFMRATAGSAEEPTPAGCLVTMIGSTIVQGVALSIYLTFIMPIILGGTGLTPLSFVADNFGTVLIAGVLGIVAMVLATMVPLVGRSEAFGAFVQSVVVCRILAGETLDYAATSLGGHVVYPGLFASIGFLLIAVVLTWLATVLVAIVTKESWAPLIGPSLGLVLGLLPAFMYMRYAVMPLLG